MPVTKEALEDAIKRIAMTPDGELLNLYLQNELQMLPPFHDDGALQADYGRRSFAARLKGLMDQATSESRNGGSGDSTSSGIVKLVVSSGVGPASGGSRRSRRRG